MLNFERWELPPEKRNSEPEYRRAGFWVREELPELQVVAWERPPGPANACDW